MSLSPGSRIGPYEVRGLLGAGGMGEVYLAWDPRLGREVALKRMSGAGSEDPEWRARFLSEARMAASLKHPGIVAIHDILWEDSVPYIVMERLEGETLRERIHRGPLPEDEARPLWLKAIRAMAAAHGQGLIHRDLKPENLFITREGELKILDFGLAKRLDLLEHDATVALQTGTGAILGTLTYLSPEQARGEPATRRSDVHALGLILFEMLTGRAAFRRGTPAEVLAAILNDDPLRDAPLTPWAAPVLRACLAKDPELRPASAAVLDDPTVRLAAPVLERSRRWLGSAVAAGLAVLGLGGLWLSRRPPAVPASTASRSPGWAALQRAEYMASRLDWNKATVSTPGQDPIVQAYQEALTADPGLLEARLGLAEHLVEWVFNREGEKSAVAPLAYEHIQRVLQVHPDDPKALELRGRLAFTHDAGYHMEEALVDLARASRLDPGNEKTRFILGTICEHVGLLDEATRIYSTSRYAGKMGFGTQYRLARVKWMNLDLEGARAIYLTLVPVGQWELPAVLERMGKAVEAQALAQTLKEFGPAGSRTFESDLQAVQSFLLARQGRGAEARALAQKAEAAGQGRAHFHHAAYHLACAYAALGDEAEALRLLRISADDGMPCYPLFQRDPRLDPLRSSPVFKLILEAQRVRWEGFKARYAEAGRT